MTWNGPQLPKIGLSICFDLIFLLQLSPHDFPKWYGLPKKQFLKNIFFQSRNTKRWLYFLIHKNFLKIRNLWHAQNCPKWLKWPKSGPNMCFSCILGLKMSHNDVWNYTYYPKLIFETKKKLVHFEHVWNFLV